MSLRLSWDRPKAQHALASYRVERLAIEHAADGQLVLRWYGAGGQLLAEQSSDFPPGAVLELERPGELTVVAIP